MVDTYIEYMPLADLLERQHPSNPIDYGLSPALLNSCR
jgi:hypothetical protein